MAKSKKETENEAKNEPKIEVKPKKEIKAEKEVEIEKEKEETKELTDKEKVDKILSKAKAKGSITYGELASELEDVNPEEIDKSVEIF